MSTSPPVLRSTADDSYPDDTIRAILTHNRTFAFVGASAATNKPSYFAMKYLLSKGFSVIDVRDPSGIRERGSQVTVDDQEIPDGAIHLLDDGRTHAVLVRANVAAYAMAAHRS